MAGCAKYGFHGVLRFCGGVYGAPMGAGSWK
jgi:hypothetical protein